MYNHQKLWVLFFVVILFSSCQHIDTKVYSTVEDMVMIQQAELDLVDPELLEQQMVNHTLGLKIIDVREPDEYEAGHIPGAVNVPRGLLEFSPKLTNRRDHIYLYSNDINRSSLSVSNLKLLKFRNISVLEGGYENWKQSFPEKVETGRGAEGGPAPVKKASSGGCGG